MTERRREPRNLSLDVYIATDDTWSAVIQEHPRRGGRGVIVWNRHGMRTSHNADVAAEAAWKRLQTEKSHA